MFLVELLNAIQEPLVEMDRRLFFIGSVLPGALVFLALAGIGYWRRKKDNAWPRWLTPVLFGVAFVFAFASVHALNSVEFWPKDGAKRILHATLLVALVGVVVELLPRKLAPARHPLVVVVLLLALAMPLLPVIDFENGTVFAIYLGASFFACALLAYSMAGAQALCPGWRVPLMAISAPFAASFVAYYGSVASLGQMAGGLTAVLSATAVAAIIVRKATIPVSGWMAVMAPVVIVVAGARAYAWSPGPVWASVLALAAPLPALLCLPQAARTKRWWIVFAIQCALIGAITLGAIWLAYQGRSTYEY